MRWAAHSPVGQTLDQKSAKFISYNEAEKEELTGSGPPVLAGRSNGSSIDGGRQSED